MRALVTGATGLVGGNLARALAARGDAVRALVRPGADTRALAGVPGLELAAGDILDGASLAAAAAGCELVFHAAAQVSLWAPDAARMRRVNVEGTANVLNAAQAAGARRLVHVSTVDAIGFATRDGRGSLACPADETTPYDNDRFGVPYIATKHEAQRLVLERCAAGLDAVVVNPAFVLGPWDLKPSSGRLLLGLARGLPGYPPGANNFVGVGDVVAGILAAAARGRRGELYILGHENLAYGEAFARIARAIGAPPPRRRLPAALVRAAGALGSAWGTLFGWAGARPEGLNRSAARLACLEHCFSPAKAVRELALPQTPLEQAAEEAWRWFVDHGYARRREVG